MCIKPEKHITVTAKYNLCSVIFLINKMMMTLTVLICISKINLYKKLSFISNPPNLLFSLINCESKTRKFAQSFMDICQNLLMNINLAISRCSATVLFSNPYCIIKLQGEGGEQ